MADREESELTKYFNKRIEENETQLLESERELRKVNEEKMEQKEQFDKELRKAREELEQTKKEQIELEKTLKSAISFIEGVPRLHVDAAEQIRYAAELKDSKEQFEAAIQEARDSIAKELQDSSDRMRAQIATLCELLLQAHWTAQAEWTERLSSLKRLHDPVRSRFLSLNDFLQTQAPGIIDFNHALGELTLLKDELDMEISIMRDEATQMKRLMIEHPGKAFLTDIEESTRAVEFAAVNLLAEIRKVEQGLKSGDASAVNLTDSQILYQKMEEMVENIPTVKTLKKKYEKNSSTTTPAIAHAQSTFV